ncbi:hypothetical protein CRG98_029468 [Punica granatum]|uniref:MADS-box domain-containing protein n=1 Tax=Punica granatum TaxID=22663 RepID=A0A2I0J1M7_PUNGR|nr:hypothetical protein CRG98_029468 [Punica granatum]
MDGNVGVTIGWRSRGLRIESTVFTCSGYAVSELATLCGAEIGLVMFSPTGVPFSIGHPSIEAVLERILNWKNGPQQQIVNGNRGQSILEARSSNRTQELREHLNENWS